MCSALMRIVALDSMSRMIKSRVCSLTGLVAEAIDEMIEDAIEDEEIEEE